MSLSPAQLLILKNYIAADPILNGQPVDGNGLGFIADALNSLSSPAFYVWRSSTQAASVGDAINWSALTPVDTPDGTATYTNRALSCQAKQINLQILLQGQSSISSNKANIRAGFQDALTNIPSGVNGANTPGGWPNVKTAMTRVATVVEKLLATGTGTTASPADLGFEGNITSNDVDTARRS